MHILPLRLGLALHQNVNGNLCQFLEWKDIVTQFAQQVPLTDLREKIHERAQFSIELNSDLICWLFINQIETLGVVPDEKLTLDS